MQNYDEALLRHRQINPGAGFPVLHQALRIALYDSYAAQSFYTRVAESFGPRPPFIDAAQAESRRIEALAAHATSFGVPRPLNPFPAETSVEPTWLANCLRAVAGEIASIRLYDQLLAHIQEPQTQSVFRHLQVETFEQHLPRFREAALAALDQERYHASRGIPPQQAYVNHGTLSNLLEGVLAQLGGQSGAIGLLGPLLRHLHPSLLAGLAVGGAGVYFATQGRSRQSVAEP